MLTFNFISRVRTFFNTISYNPKTIISLIDLESNFVGWVCRCKNIDDINDLIFEYLFVLKKVNKINKLLKSKKRHTYDELESDYKLPISFFSLDESYGNSIFTTVLSKNKSKLNFMYSGGTKIFGVSKNQRLYRL